MDPGFCSLLTIYPTGYFDYIQGDPYSGAPFTAGKEQRPPALKGRATPGLARHSPCDGRHCRTGMPVGGRYDVFSPGVWLRPPKKELPGATSLKSY